MAKKKEVVDFAKDKIINDVIPKIIPFLLDDTCKTINNLLKKDSTACFCRGKDKVAQV